MRCPLGNTHLQSYEKHMVEENRAYWAPMQMRGEKWIYVYHEWPECQIFDLFESIVAKGLQDREKSPIISMTYLDTVSEANRKFTNELDDSFGIKEQCQIVANRRVSWLSNVRTFLAAQFISHFTYGKKEKLFLARYRGIEIGDRIHDAILREVSISSRGKQADCFDISQFSYFQYIRRSLLIIDQAYAIFKKRKPAYVVTSECLYAPGLAGDVASKLGAKLIINPPRGGWKILVQINPGSRFFLGDMIRQQIETYMQKTSWTEDSEEDFFVMSMENTSEQNLTQRLGLDPNKKNVFILPQILIDTPRESYEHGIYHDYNEWLLSTLKIIQNVSNVNWIIKDHPMSAAYLQDGYIKRQFEKYKTSNMYWCDKAISGVKIKEIADCVITCSGDVGLEYWAYGIPTITTSKSFYCDWGISYSMKTQKEYEAVLQNIEGLQPPTPQSMKAAQRYLFVSKHMSDSEDELTLLFKSTFEKYYKAQKKGESFDGLAPYLLCKKYTEFLNTRQVEKSSIYRLENICELS